MLLQLLQSGVCPIGLDVASTGIRALQIRKGRAGYSVLGAARVDFDFETLELPWKQRVESALPSLRRKIEEGGFAGRRCVLAIDDETLRTRSIRQPRMPREEADRALRLEAADRLGFENSDQVEVDWLRAGEVRQGEDLRDELIIVGALRSNVEWLVETFVESGLRPAAVEPRFVASGRCFSRKHRRAADQGSIRLVVEIGWIRSSVIVLRGAHVVFFKSFEQGGAQMNLAAAKRLEMDAKATLELRRQRMFSPGAENNCDPRVDRAIFDAIRPVLDEFAEEIGRCLRYYTVTFRGGRPDYAIVVGPEAREPGLTDLLTEMLHTEVSVGRPLEGVDTSNAGAGFDRRTELSDWAVGAGLSLRMDEAADASMRSRRGGDEPREEAGASKEAA